jgi:hypothetical protein
MKRSRKTMIAAGLTFMAVLQQARADVVVIVSAHSAARLTAKEISQVYLGERNTMTPVDIAVVETRICREGFGSQGAGFGRGGRESRCRRSERHRLRGQELREYDGESHFDSEMTAGPRTAPARMPAEGRQARARPQPHR